MPRRIRDDHKAFLLAVDRARQRHKKRKRSRRLSDVGLIPDVNDLPFFREYLKEQYLARRTKYQQDASFLDELRAVGNYPEPTQATPEPFKGEFYQLSIGELIKTGDLAMSTMQEVPEDLVGLRVIEQCPIARKLWAFGVLP